MFANGYRYNRLNTFGWVCANSYYRSNYPYRRDRSWAGAIQLSQSYTPPYSVQ